MERIKGKTVWFSAEKGYGFLRPDGGNDQDDIFVHFSVIESDGYKKLVEGEAVEYSIEPGPKGKPQATSVVKLQPASQAASS